MTETTKPEPISEQPVDTEALMIEMANVQRCLELVKDTRQGQDHRSYLLKLSQHVQGLHLLLSAALRELKALRQENEWIKATPETLPEDMVMVQYNELAADRAESEEDGVHEWYRGEIDIANPFFVESHQEYIAHWRPLPAPPAPRTEEQ